MSEIIGDGNDNLLEGTEDPDLIKGRGGDDTIYGFGSFDELIGNAGNDLLYGGDGGDTLSGGPGNDILYGEADIDYLSGGEGDDILDGGEGDDTATYFDSATAVSIDLEHGIADGEGMDLLVSIENAEGSQYDDTLRGDADTNTLYGHGGDDHFHATAGNDYYHGGSGTDTVDFSAFGHGLTIQWSSASGPNVSIAYFQMEVAIGTDFDDTIIGFDEIHGLAGDDWLYLEEGGAMHGGAGNDVLVQSFQDDTLDGGEGLDFVYASTGFFTTQNGDAVYGVNYDLTIAIQVNQGAEGVQTDIFTNIEGVAGTAYADTLTGNEFANMLWGWSERGTGHNNDTIVAGDGDDWVIVGEGDHDLSGDDGQDVLEFFGTSRDTSAGTGFTFSLALQGGAQDTGVGMMTATGFEHLTGGFDDDHLTGDAGDNQLSGGGGADTLTGGEGNDTLRGDATTHMDEDGWHLSLEGVTDTGDNDDALYGEAGNDELYGDYGSDHLDGGSGDDMLDGGAGGDVLIGGTGTDRLDGGDGHDRLSGGDGHDTLTGGNGNDTLAGGDGRDALYGGAKADTLTGGRDNDRLDGSAGNDTLDGGKGNDVLKGGNGADTLSGGNGDDTISGHKGNDWIDGGIGHDTLSGNLGDDIFHFGLDSGIDIVTDFESGDTIAFDSALELSFGDLVIVDEGGSASISWGTSDSILLDGVAADSLTQADFDFGVAMLMQHDRAPLDWGGSDMVAADELGALALAAAL